MFKSLPYVIFGRKSLNQKWHYSSLYFLIASGNHQGIGASKCALVC